MFPHETVLAAFKMSSFVLMALVTATEVFATRISPQAAVPYESWANLIKAGKCSSPHHDAAAHFGIACMEDTDTGAAHFYFPPGIFELGEQGCKEVPLIRN